MLTDYFLFLSPKSSLIVLAVAFIVFFILFYHLVNELAQYYFDVFGTPEDQTLTHEFVPNTEPEIDFSKPVKEKVRVKNRKHR